MKITDWFMTKDLDTIVSNLQDFPNHPNLKEIVEHSKKNAIRLQVRTADDLLVLGLSPDLVRPSWLKEDLFKYSFKDCKIVAYCNYSDTREFFREKGFREKSGVLIYKANS